MPSATVLFSGGLDSTVLLHYVVHERKDDPVFALSFRYGQRHDREIDMAAWQVRRLAAQARVEHHVCDLTALAEVVGGASALVNGGPEVPNLGDIAAAERAQPPTYVPNRNMVLLSLAAAFAEAHDCRIVYYGAQAQDEYGYWDCTRQFVDRINAVLALNRSEPVRILAPFVGRSKAEIVRLGLELGADFSHTWSCYRGGAIPCGRCPTCVERRNAFERAGAPDPGCTS